MIQNFVKAFSSQQTFSHKSCLFLSRNFVVIVIENETHFHKKVQFVKILRFSKLGIILHLSPGSKWVIIMSHDYSNLEQQHNRGPGAHLSSSSRPSLENVIQTKLLFSPFQERTLSHSPGQVQQFQVCRTTFPAIQIPKNKSLH